MNYQVLYDAVRPRHRVWCTSDALTAGETEGTYVFADEAMNALLGVGSEIIVMDENVLMFWTGEAAYPWGGAD